MNGTDRRTTTRSVGRRARSVDARVRSSSFSVDDRSSRATTPIASTPGRARRRSASIVTGGARHVAVRVVFGE
jgi:hypothetical protein